MTDTAALQAQMAVFLRRPRDLTSDDEARRFAAEHLGGNERLSPVEQLEIYREQFFLRHTASLVEDFPGVGGILGQSDWDRLVWDYLGQETLASHDLGDLGAGLAAFAETRAWLGERALVRDMARLEYAHVEVFDAPDAARLEPTKLAAVPEDAWERARLVPDPGLRVLHFEYPVIELRRRILLANERGETARVALPAAQAGDFAVHRRERNIFHDALEPSALSLLAALARGEPLGLACENAAQQSGVAIEELGQKLERWFADWSARGYLVDVIVSGQ